MRSCQRQTLQPICQELQLRLEKSFIPLAPWLSNPLPDSKDFSLIEVDILDQYVTDMLSFTRGALSDVETPRHSLAVEEEMTEQGSYSQHFIF